MTDDEARKVARIISAAIGATQAINDPDFVLGVATGIAHKEFPTFHWVELISQEDKEIQKHVRDVKRIL